jgi:NAD(P)-dependent dehydrogenase (short-subunit alcohol dehydrogenase family)
VRNVVVTGANRGVGLALVKEFSAAGDHVIGGCRRPDSATDLRATGAEVLAVDTSSDVSLVDFARGIGDRQIDILINNAGVNAGALGAADNARGALDISPEQFLGVMNINVVGPLRLVQLLAPNLRAARGTVANISSQVGSFEVAQRIGRDVAYAASKTALNMVTLKQSQALRSEGVTVICIHPGWVKTSMGGSGADVEPADAAAGIVKVLGRVSLEDTGRFFRWDGSEHPW